MLALCLTFVCGGKMRGEIRQGRVTGLAIPVTYVTGSSEDAFSAKRILIVISIS